MAQLWLTPMPRVIVATGAGRTFRVVGGAGVTVTTIAASSNNQEERTDLFVYKEDSLPVGPLPDGVQAVAASPTLAAMTTFECFLLSGHAPRVLPHG